MLPMGVVSVLLLCCYAPEDEVHCAALGRHLAQLKREGSVELCPVLPGDSVTADIQLAQANLVIFLLTSHFLSSDQCRELLHRAQQTQQHRKLRLVPVVVSPCDWEASELGSLHAWPRNRRPVTSWPSQDAAWQDVVQGIRGIAAPGSTVGSAHGAGLPDLASQSSAIEVGRDAIVNANVAGRHNMIHVAVQVQSPLLVEQLGTSMTGDVDGKSRRIVSYRRGLAMGAALLLLVAGSLSVAFRERVPADMIRIPWGYLRWNGPSPAASHWIWPFALERDEVTRGAMLRWLEGRSGVRELNGRFRDFDGVLLLDLNGAGFTREDRTNRPVSGVTYDGAVRYCETHGRRLLRYEEWARAARSAPDWSQVPLPCMQVACGQNGGECGLGGPPEVGTASQDRSAEGVRDLSGGVSEWVQKQGGQHFARGGSFAREAVNCSGGFSVALQSGVGYGDVGFRCALSLGWWYWP